MHDVWITRYAVDSLSKLHEIARQVLFTLTFCSGKTKKTTSSHSKGSAVKPQYMESSTESEDEDDRKLDRRLVNTLVITLIGNN